MHVDSAPLSKEPEQEQHKPSWAQDTKERGKDCAISSLRIVVLWRNETYWKTKDTEDTEDTESAWMHMAIHIQGLSSWLQQCGLFVCWLWNISRQLGSLVWSQWDWDLRDFYGLLASTVLQVGWKVHGDALRWSSLAQTCKNIVTPCVTKTGPGKRQTPKTENSLTPYLQTAESYAWTLAVWGASLKDCFVA